MGQLKYLAMLRYSASTVMELDADSGVYHLVYQQNEDFQDLRSGGTFEQALRTFAERSVHPDDRAIVLNIPDKYAVEFFSSGLMRRSRTYRILHRATGEYIWYEASAIRVDLENPKHRKVLIIWKQLEPQVREDLQTPGADSAMPVAQNLLVGIQQCRSDAQFTITYVNDGLLNLLGYTRQEIQDLFHDRYLEMIYPADRLSVRRRFLEQLSSGKAGKLEYRVLAKNRPPVWVLDQWQLISDAEGMDYCNCVLTDITQVKQVQEELRLHMEQYRIILDQTNDIIFEWDLQEDRITYSSNWEKKFGYQPASSGAQIQTASHLFPADVPILMNLIQDVSSGMPYREVEVRIADRDGKYIWCRIRATTQFDDGRKPIKAVGVILDIDLEMRRTQELIHQAEQDSLTNLYTKNTACDIIRRALEQREPEARFALMIIDLDNFKQINDSFGHMFGDAVLAEAAAQLKRLFRTGDVVARFGGDEFLVFLQHTADRPFLECKAQCILETFFNVFPGQLKHCRLTCSVGISRCPEDGLDFQDLFQP